MQHGEVQPPIDCSPFDASKFKKSKENPMPAWLEAKGSRFLCSPNSRDCIFALVENSTIEDVPVERRNAAFNTFSKTVVAWEHRRDNKQRMPLLCNAGYRGTGKTVLLSFNQYWFALRGGFSVQITFNDDQSAGFFDFDSRGSFLSIHTEFHFASCTADWSTILAPL